MGFNMRNRSLLKTADLTQREFRYLLDLARDLKRAKYAKTEQQHLRGKNIALIFEKTSTRTRCAFEVAAFDQGARITFLDPTSSQIGHKESVKDTARVLGRMYDAIEFRGYSQEIVDSIQQYSNVPVYNGLTDDDHPTQMLADILTMREHSDKPLHDISYAYVGDCRSNMGHSLMVAGLLVGMDVRICGPRQLWPDEAHIRRGREVEAAYGGRLTVTDDPKAAAQDVDFIYTDVWVSMGEPKEIWQSRIEMLRPYQVNAALLAASGNPKIRFMHCLPAFHNTETAVGRDIEAHFGLAELEVTEDVFESEASIVFEQAENRMHTIKALMVATLGD